MQMAFDERAQMNAASRKELQQLYPFLRATALQAENMARSIFATLLKQTFVGTESILQDETLLLVNLCITHDPMPCLRMLVDACDKQPAKALLFLSYIHNQLRDKRYSAEAVRGGGFRVQAVINWAPLQVIPPKMASAARNIQTLVARRLQEVGNGACDACR